MDERKVKVRSFLEKYIRSSFSDEDHLYNQGLVNSLFAMQLIVYLENTYRITVDNEDLDLNNFKSVEAICSFIERKQNL